MNIAERFRGFLPVVVDLETGGFNADTDAILEMAAVVIKMDADGRIRPGERHFFNVAPFEGSNIEAASLEFTGIDPGHPFRNEVSEASALNTTFGSIRKEMKHTGCSRAILVAHNAAFDHAFIRQAVIRCGIKRSPFHPFSAFDTVSLGGLAVGQTVLAKACRACGIEFEDQEAHTALYDCDKTAELFCYVVNRWQPLLDVNTLSSDDL